jgi:c-di-GMP-binding flagellar brake protein YcgR
MSATLLLVIVVSALGLIVLALVGLGGDRSPWIRFYARGKASGFTLAELNYLKGISLEIKLQDPLSLFWSDKSLDRAIKRISARKRAEGAEKENEVLEFMAKLYDFRKRVEFERPKTRYGIKSTRSIAPGTKLRVLVERLGVYNSTAFQNTQQALIISLPTGRRLPEGFKWTGKRLSVYFWRAEDAGYVFDTYVMQEGTDGRVPVIHVGHTDTLFRTQKRRSIRAKSRIPAFLYVLKRIEGAYEKPERVPGMKCVVEDISEDGAAVFIGGRAKPMMNLKLQFKLGDVQVVMSGTAKGVEYDSDKNQSLIHVQAVPPSPRMKNIILSYVYNVFEEDEQG